MTGRYNIYSKYLKEHYGEKLQTSHKTGFDLSQQRWKVGTRWLIYCNAKVEASKTKKTPFNLVRIGKTNNIENKYSAHKFISYFQNYSNTYMPLELLEQYVNEAVVENVAVSVSTRPDYIALSIWKY
ncbi:MAG: hypothetical protein ACLS8T_23870 [Anaerobutyricum sp.]